jgi:hypothetical protein
VYRLFDGIAGEPLRLARPEVGKTPAAFTFFENNRVGMIE